jgi:TRAP-type C4-dicarboxylate transport system permease small subunit
MPGRLRALHDGITSVAFVLGCTALALLLLTYLWEVVARYGFNAPTRWSADVVQYALCASTTLCLPQVTRDGGHVAITSFLEKLSAQHMQIASRLIQGFGATVLLLTALVFGLVAKEQAAQGIETVAAFAVPKWWLTGLVVFGLATAALHLARQALGADTAQAGHEMDL